MAVAERSNSSLAYASRSSSVFTAPTGITDGDWLVCFLVTAGSTTGTGHCTITPPTGFSEISPFPTTQDKPADPFYEQWHLYAKKASGESGNYTFGQSATCNTEGIMYCISGADGTSPFTPTPTINNGTGTTLTATGLTGVVANSLVIFGGITWDDSRNMSGPSGTTPTFSTDYAGGSTLISYYSSGTWAAGGSTGNKTSTASDQLSTSPWHASLVALQPPASASESSEIIAARHLISLP